jgi:hypothetical protein
VSFFSDVFSTNDSDSLPDWLRTGAAIVDEGLDLYDRIGQGGEQPQLPPIQTQSAAPASPFGLTPMVALVGGVILLYVFFGMSSRRR